MSDPDKQYDPPVAEEIETGGEPAETAAITATDA
jgi:hypothetical protein